MNHTFVFHWTRRFVSECPLKNSSPGPGCQNTKATRHTVNEIETKRNTSHVVARAVSKLNSSVLVHPVAPPPGACAASDSAHPDRSVDPHSIPDFFCCFTQS